MSYTPSRIDEIKSKLKFYQPIYAIKTSSCCSVEYKYMLPAIDDIKYLIDAVEELTNTIEQYLLTNVSEE